MNKYYAILGLPATASKEEVRRKYRQLVLIWHPDRNSSPDAHGKFIAITEAYDILMGERAIPRTTYTARPKSPTGTTTRRQQATTAHRTKAQMLSEKFHKIRNEHLNHPHRERLKSEMYANAKTNFTVAGIILFGALILPFLFGSAWHLIWCLPVGGGLGMRFLWKGGRFKLRADMIFGQRSAYSNEEIAEFFTDSPGYTQVFGEPDKSRWH